MISINDYPRLFLCLDSTLRNVFTVLTFLSNEKTNNNGWFSATNKELLALTKISVNPTIAALETLYRANLLDVVVSPFSTSGRTANRYRLKVENFNQDFQPIATLNYHSTDYQITYNLKKASQEPQKDVTLTTIHKERKNATAAKEIALNEVLATVVEPRTYITPTEKREKIEKNAEILINRLRQCKEWEDYKNKMEKYEQWLNKCFQTLDDDSLKHQLLKKAQHIMDEITFSNDIPKPTEYTNFPTVRKVEKVYIYLGDEAKDEEMTVSQCAERGYNVRLLFDTDKHIFFCPS